MHPGVGEGVEPLFSDAAEPQLLDDSDGEPENLGRQQLAQLPVLRRLRRKTKPPDPERWNARHKGMLRAHLADGIWLPKVCICGEEATTQHLLYGCLATQRFLREYGFSVETSRLLRVDPTNPLWVTGLVPDPRRDLPKPLLELKVIWVVAPGEQPCFDSVGYGDGSGIHGRDPVRRRCGWSVISTLVDWPNISPKALAYGNLPAPLQEVPASELLAFCFYLQHALPDESGAMYVTDCAWVVETWGKGEYAATHSGAVHADIWRKTFLAAKNLGIENVRVRKVKAHRALGSAASRDDAHDILANKLADEAAKKGASLHPTAPQVDEQIRCTEDLVTEVAQYIGRAALWRQQVYGALPRNEASTGGFEPLARAPVDRVAKHVLVNEEGGFRCTRCVSAARSRAALERHPCLQEPLQRQHSLLRSGPYIFCGDCGSYTSTAVSKSKVYNLHRSCLGKPLDDTSARRRDRLLQGKCPFTGKSLVGFHGSAERISWSPGWFCAYGFR